MKNPESTCPKPDPLFGAEHISSQHHRLWRPRGIDDWLLWFTVDGRVEVCHDNDQLTMTRGDWCLIPPHIPHDYGTLSEAEPIWHVAWVVFRLKPSWLPLTNWSTSFKEIYIQNLEDKSAEAEALRALRESLSFQDAGWPGSTALACNRLEACLLWLNAGTSENAWDARIRAVVDEMVEHLDRPIDLRQMAAKASISIPQFSRLFQRDVGTSPSRWLQQHRLERARLYLENGHESIAMIAKKCGFSDASYFCRCFKAHYGRTPGQHRQKKN